MAKLNEGMQRFIVQALACYDTPTQFAESVKEEFGIEVTRQQAASYDPTKVTSKALAMKWRDLFALTRDRFRTETADIPIAQFASTRAHRGEGRKDMESSLNASGARAGSQRGWRCLRKSQARPTEAARN